MIGTVDKGGSGDSGGDVRPSRHQQNIFGREAKRWEKKEIQDDKGDG